MGWNVDLQAGTVTIADRVLPLVTIICPPTDDRPEETLWNRSLVCDSRVAQTPIGETGLLLILHARTTSYSGTPLDAYIEVISRHCDFEQDCWLPKSVGVINAQIQPADQPHHNPDPDWLLEHIDRIARLPQHPDPTTGPPCQLTPHTPPTP